MVMNKTQQKGEKLKEIVWYICENYNQQLFETKLWKLVFFCDTDYFQKYDTPITQVSYIKNRRGPTPDYSIAKKSISELIKDGYIKKSENGTYVAMKDYKLNYLDNHHIDAINATCDKYHRLTVTEICTLSHRDPVYLAAENLNDVLDFNFVAYRDDGAYDEDDTIESLPKVISFSKKAEINLMKMVMA